LAETAQAYTIESFSTSDGYAWRYRRYVPLGETAQRGHVVCLHGIQSHAGWYEHSCTEISKAGYLVSFLDRRGSGLNERDRGDAPHYPRLVEDVAEFIADFRKGKQDGPRPQLYLLAISWGGKLALALQQSHPDLVDGLILLCPGFFPKVRPPLRERLAIACSRLCVPRCRFPIPLNDPDLFTASALWQRFLREDPLSLHQATARFLVESVRLDRLLRQAPPCIRTPVLLLLAQQDRIIDNTRTRQFVEQFASKYKQIIEYPGASHTLEFEENPDIFIGDICNWLDGRCRSDPS
jgi:alpha-beta hydrolase superfamily lysophospholipase